MARIFHKGKNLPVVSIGKNLTSKIDFLCILIVDVATFAILRELNLVDWLQST